MRGIRGGAIGCALVGGMLAFGFFAAPRSVFGQDSAKAQQEAKEKFLEQMNKSKYALTLANGKVLGLGMNTLSDAMADAQFVLIGEDHGIAEIPQFMGSVFEMLAPRGFHTLAIETGPYVTGALHKFASKPDGAAQMSEFVKKYPFPVAFYNWQEEFAFLQRCARAEKDGKISLWGLDQELMGSSGYLLAQISEEKLGPDAKAMADRMVKEEEAAYAAASKTGDPGRLFMMTAKDADLKAFGDLLKTQGTAAAQEMLASLEESREIYKKFMANEGYASNRERAQLMKQNFKTRYLAASDPEPLPKVMFKFGGYHMYRGLNSLHSSEIGNMVAELAEWNGTKSVHILIFGVKGEEAAFAGIGKPSAVAPLDLKADTRGDFGFLAPMLDNMLKDSWTMYDLRALRAHFGSYGAVSGEIERMIFGYDFLVLIPNTTASHDLQ